NRFRFVSVDVDRKTKIGRQISAHFTPGIAGIVAAHYVPVFLHEERVRTRWVQCDPVNTVADLRIGIGNVLRMQTAIDRLPGFAAVIGAERARGGNRDEYSLRIAWIDQDRVQTHPARARL